MAKILIVDDEDRIREILQIILFGAGHEVCEAENGVKALSVLERETVDLVISDMRMDEMSGLDLLSAIRERELGLPLIFITAFATLDSAVEALRLGAADYLVKPFEEEAVLLAVERALGVGKLIAENIRLKQDVAATEEPQGIFISPPMQKVKKLAQKVAQSDATVLITGESGTGKEVVSRFIHQSGNRNAERFVALNCAAIAQNLLEAELFGHEKGAFTGADKARVGKFEFAGEGTLFLDEIGELPLDSQAKLLRVLQEKCVHPVGGNREVPVSCRLICATNKDLSQMVRQGLFREDLFYRLTVFPIPLPSLRDRKEDIVPLVEFYLQNFGGGRDPEGALTPGAERKLLEYSWPGNVRELFNALERALIMNEVGEPLTADDFPHLGVQSLAVVEQEGEFVLPPSGIDYEELQQSIVMQALELTNGNQSGAARLLSVSRAKFRTMLGQLGGAPQGGSVRIVLRRGGNPS